MNTKISRGSGDVRVELRIDKYGMCLYVMRNGHHWSGGTIVDEHIPMIFDVLKEYLASKEPEYCWECNECGWQECSVADSSQEYMHENVACGFCGCVEWHKAACRE